ncbi:leucine-rich repeat-containing protein 56 isoform X2 [Neocloeon triangulifer]|nr:leucine-rich repeat-containing protein 56 isoform X2 [Neocloeon triangulifer]
MFDALEAEALNQADPNVPIMPVEVPPPPQFSAVIGFDMDALMEQIEDGTDFNEVKTISLKTLVQDTSLQRLGFLMPNLQQLILSGSYLLSLRELGTGMNHLTELRVDNCSLRSLDGLSALASLQELHAPHNPVADIWSCSVLPELKILNLSYTQVTNPSQAGFLAPCRSLQALSLFGSPAAGRSNYRSEIARQLPNLTSLDGQPLARGRRSNADGADDDEGEADGESPRARPGRNDRDLASIRVTTDRQSDDDDDGYDTPSK